MRRSTMPCAAMVMMALGGEQFLLFFTFYAFTSPPREERPHERVHVCEGVKVWFAVKTVTPSLSLSP